jgi:hypothetical protein
MQKINSPSDTSSESAEFAAAIKDKSNSEINVLLGFVEKGRNFDRSVAHAHVNVVLRYPIKALFELPHRHCKVVFWAESH